MSAGDLLTSFDVVASPAHPPRSRHRRGFEQPVAFATQLATFYPYCREPVDPQPRAAAADARQRPGTVGDAASMRRRRYGRED